jgi:methylthioribulose-1-phosphate dehydratase
MLDCSGLLINRGSGTPLFFAAYKHCNAGAVIHTHSQHAVRATLISGDVFQITHQEMIKGIRQVRDCCVYSKCPC